MTDPITHLNAPLQGRYRVEVVEVQAGSFVVRADSASPEVEVSVASGTQLDVRRPRSRGRVPVWGALWSALAGGVVSVGLLPGAVSFIPAGAMVSGILGAAFPGERWEEVLSDQMSIAPGRDGSLALSVSYSF